ncbi:MAG: ABC transporter ATP-binding protein [Bacilli bacterium]|nr:ABC transporter ATP-binding protein [Bacilli bacterium]
MLKINNLTKYYGKNKGVEDINLDISKGEIFGFIGPNGSGKSTTIKCIMNLINKNNGEIFINKEEIKKKNFNIKEKIGYLPSEVNLYDDLTVKQMIEYSNSFYKKDCMKKANELVKRLELDLNKKIEQLSLGNLKKVGIVLTFMHSPKIAILDEATSGLDPLMQEEFYKILLEEKEKGMTIFFSSHILSEIKKVCDRVAIIKNGQIIKIENINTIRNNEFITITIEANNIKEFKKILNDSIIEENHKMIKFIYTGDINKLIKELNKYDVDKLLIEEPSIEEIFMHYYKED